MTETDKNGIPWTEKYRPVKFMNIVLDPINRSLFQNVLDKQHFPNLLFYGPPGTGKTTTIINLINEYQFRYNNSSKGTVIHLNASDERGIDIIRNQINQFVKSRNLFETGFKFVVLDEVDYMTKTAQQALKYLLQTSTYNVRFCLICNYISKIDESLQNEFISIRFNQLPKPEIYSFIKIIAEKEKLSLTDKDIDTIQVIYNSDIRSMINFIQLNQNLVNWENNIINHVVWEKIHELLIGGGKRELERAGFPKVEIVGERLNSVVPVGSRRSLATSGSEPFADATVYVANELAVVKYIHEISIKYNMDKKHIIQTYFNYIIRNYGNLICPKFLDIVETIMHNYDTRIEYTLNYFGFCMKSYYADVVSE